MDNVWKARIAGFVLGAIFGSAAMGVFYSHHFLKGQRVAFIGIGIHERLRVLESLRRGDTAGALGTLETGLSGSLAILSPDIDEKVDGPMAATLHRAAQYRAAHPRSSGSAQLDDAEKRVLAIGAGVGQSRK